jgi:hypothetical protein
MTSPSLSWASVFCYACGGGGEGGGEGSGGDGGVGTEGPTCAHVFVTEGPPGQRGDDSGVVGHSGVGRRGCPCDRGWGTLQALGGGRGRQGAVCQSRSRRGSVRQALAATSTLDLMKNMSWRLLRRRARPLSAALAHDSFMARWQGACHRSVSLDLAVVAPSRKCALHSVVVVAEVAEAFPL